jgi:hypothetical protein
MNKNQNKTVSLTIILLAAIVLSWTFNILTAREAIADTMRRPKNYLIPREIKPAKEELLIAERIVMICKENGLTKDEDIKWVLGKLWNESRWDQYAIGVNKGGTIDRGIAQINNHYHPEISNECAFDLKCSLEFVIKYRKDGKDIWYGSDNL